MAFLGMDGVNDTRISGETFLFRREEASGVEWWVCYSQLVSVLLHILLFLILILFFLVLFSGSFSPWINRPSTMLN